MAFDLRESATRELGFAIYYETMADAFRHCGILDEAAQAARQSDLCFSMACFFESVAQSSTLARFDGHDEKEAA